MQAAISGEQELSGLDHSIRIQSHSDSTGSYLYRVIMGTLHHRRAASGWPAGDDEEIVLLDETESPTGDGLGEVSTSAAQAERELPWTPRAVAAAAIVCLGTSISTLFLQRVSNTVPQYFYAVAIVSPILGFLCYTAILFCFQVVNHYGYGYTQHTVSVQQQDAWDSTTQLSLIQYTSGIGACFAFHNILVDYGRSGTARGHPDVSAVLSLILLKLVVPVSLGLESLLERQLPTWNQLMGVVVFLLGILAAANRRPTASPSDAADTVGHTWKILALVASSVPLALGFYIVKVVRRRLPHVSGLRLWQVLCLPEMLFSIVLALVSQHQKQASRGRIAKDVYCGVMCVLLGFGGNDDSSCRSAALYLWSGLPFGLALNVSIPVLIHLKGSSTSVPLFRALALPIAALLAMTGWIVESPPFAWEAVAGVFICSLGLSLFYGIEPQGRPRQRRRRDITLADP